MRSDTIYRTTTKLAGVSLLAMGLWAGQNQQVLAADFGGDCCSDLEERIAELEQTTVRKGNRKVSLTLTGHVHSAVMHWDDGFEDNVYVVGSSNDSVDQTSFQFDGNAQISREWSAGYHVTIRVNAALSGEVSQDDDNASGDPLSLWEAYWYAESSRLGRVSLGQVSRASDGVPETDLSGTRPAAYAGVQSLGGGFALRRADGALSELTYGDLYSHLNGDTANVVRYESPSLMGLSFVGTYGEDDIWDVALNFEGSNGAFDVAASVAYSQLRDAGGLDGSADDPDSKLVVGSVGVLHKPSGLNALIAAGRQSFDEQVPDADGAWRTPANAQFIYTKLGLIAKLNSLGPTSLYGEYGHFEDFSSAGTDAGTVASLAAAGACATPGSCRLSGTESDVWGLGVVQDIDAAAMKIYVGYRYHETSIDLADGAGNNVAGAPIDNLQTLVVGSIIEF